MNTNTFLERHTLTRRKLTSMAGVTMLGLIWLGPANIGAQPVSSGLPSIQAVPVAELNQIAVHGEGFTPGGLVKISVVANTTSQVSRQLWVVASGSFYGPNGSQDPAWNSGESGIVDAVIPFGPMTLFGPNGSQDPANGYSEQPALVDGSMCSIAFDVQAMDQKTGAVSELFHLEPTCSGAQVPAHDGAPGAPIKPRHSYPLPF